MAWFTVAAKAPSCEKINGTGHSFLCRDVYEALFIDRGSFLLTVNGKNVRLKENELILISPGVVTSLEAPENGAYISLLFPRELAAVCRVSLPLFFVGDLPDGVFSSGFAEKNRIKELLNGLCSCPEGAAGELFIHSAALRLLAAVYEKTEQSPAGIKNGFSDILLFVNEHFTDISEEETARRFSLSYSYFSRLFRGVTGMSFKDYINFLRVSAARELLRGTEKSAAEISGLLGFSSASHFINVFKTRTGFSPMRYKKTQFNHMKDQ